MRKLRELGKIIVVIMFMLIVVYEKPIKATEVVPDVPTVSIKKVNSGTGVKITIKRTAGATGYYIYLTKRVNEYSKYLYNNGEYNYCYEYVSDSKLKNGKYSYIIKGLPEGKYSFVVAAEGEPYREWDEIFEEYMTTSKYSYSMPKTVKIKAVKSTDKNDKKSDYSNIKPGDIIKFGSYEQDDNITNGKEALEWIVLSKNKDKLLLLSRYVIDVLPYDKGYNSIMWEGCSLRKWLNKCFYNTAFSKSEKKRIETTYLVNADNENKEGGNDTKDKVFLLSLEDIINADYGFSSDYLSKDTLRCAVATKYAKVQGACTYDSVGSNCWWWLRTPGNADSILFSAAKVDKDGSVDSYGYFSGFDEGMTYLYNGINLGFNGDCVGCVRPAIYVSLF